MGLGFAYRHLDWILHLTASGRTVILSASICGNPYHLHLYNRIRSGHWGRLWSGLRCRFGSRFRSGLRCRFRSRFRCRFGRRFKSGFWGRFKSRLRSSDNGRLRNRRSGSTAGSLCGKTHQTGKHDCCYQQSLYIPTSTRNCPKIGDWTNRKTENCTGRKEDKSNLQTANKTAKCHERTDGKDDPPLFILLRRGNGHTRLRRYKRRRRCLLLHMGRSRWCFTLPSRPWLFAV